MSTHPASAQLGYTQPTQDTHPHDHFGKEQSHKRPKLCLGGEKKTRRNESNDKRYTSVTIGANHLFTTQGLREKGSPKATPPGRE